MPVMIETVAKRSKIRVISPDTIAIAKIPLSNAKSGVVGNEVADTDCDTVAVD